MIASLLVVTMLAAGGIDLSFTRGRVTIDASNVSAADIVHEWARIGGVDVVNPEYLSTVPLSIHLVAVPEEEALDVVLRSSNGYVARRRIAAVVDGDARSVFDRIVIARSTASPAPALAGPPAQRPPPFLPPRSTPAPPPAAPLDPSGAQRIIGPDGLPVEDDQQGAPPPTPTGGVR